LGCNFSGTPSQGFPVTKHQGVFPAKKKRERSANPISDPEKKCERSANSVNSVLQKHVSRVTKISFFGIFFFSFRRIKEKIKEKIEKDNKE
jgi:hypothetical protein